RFRMWPRRPCRPSIYLPSRRFTNRPLPDVHEDVGTMARVREHRARVRVPDDEIARGREEPDRRPVGADVRIGAGVVRLRPSAVDADAHRLAGQPVVYEDIGTLTGDVVEERPASVRVAGDEVRRDRVERDQATVAADPGAEGRPAADSRAHALTVRLAAEAVDADALGRTAEQVVDEDIGHAVRVAGDEVRRRGVE